jgi:hypothetical protein
MVYEGLGFELSYSFVGNSVVLSLFRRNLGCSFTGNSVLLQGIQLLFRSSVGGLIAL